MTRSRDLGQPLAIAGAAIAIIAVIAGFIVIGGPGDARDRRLDDMTTQRLYTVAAMVNCAFAIDGVAPPDMNAARASTANAVRTQPDKVACAQFTPDSDMLGADYTRIDDTSIRLCADFRRPYTAVPGAQPEFRSPDYMAFPELRASRPAGRYCYDIQLTRTPTSAPQ